MLSLGFKELISMERQYGNKGRAEQRLGSDSSYWPRGRGEGGEGSPYNGQYCRTPLKRGNIFRLQVYERAGVSLVEVHDRVEKSLMFVCKKVQKG